MKIIVSIIIVAIIALVVGFVPVMEIPYTEIVQYQDTEIYYEDEPYEDIEVYYEREPYEVTETYYVDEPYEALETYVEAVPLAYEYVKTSARVDIYTPIVSVTVRNTDSVPGVFTVIFNVKFAGTTIAPGSIHMWSKQYSDKKELHLKPDEIGTAEHRADEVNVREHSWSWEYETTPSTKTVEKERTITKYRQVEKERMITQYREVEKERPVIKFRQVEKERTVTKERFETHYRKVPIFEYILARF